VEAAYLPIDPAYPEAHLRETLSDAAPFALITDSHLSLAHEKILLFDLATLTQADLVPVPLQIPLPEDLACVLHTSRSTGKPKGVEVTHANVCSLLSNTLPLFALGADEVWTLFHSFAFDYPSLPSARRPRRCSTTNATWPSQMTSPSRSRWSAATVRRKLPSRSP